MNTLNVSDLIREVIVDNVDSMSLTQAEYLQLITTPISDTHDILIANEELEEAEVNSETAEKHNTY